MRHVVAQCLQREAPPVALDVLGPRHGPWRLQDLKVHLQLRREAPQARELGLAAAERHHRTRRAAGAPDAPQ